MIFQVPGMITKITTMMKGLRIYIDTQDNLAPEMHKRLFDLYSQEQLGWFTFNVHKIEPEDIVDLPKIQGEEVKSMSKRLRSVLYRLWEKNNRGYDDSELHYRYYMAKFIDMVKSELEKYNE